MKIQRTKYSSSIDSIIALAKRLSIYEEGNQMTSEDFFDQFGSVKSSMIK